MNIKTVKRTVWRFREHEIHLMINYSICFKAEQKGMEDGDEKRQR